ncbi:MAG: ester cyclase [Acidobacteriota bacterium]
MQKKTHQGKAALRESFTQLLAMHTKIGLEDLRRVVSGNQAVWEVRYTGALAGEILGLPEDPEYSIRAVLLFKFEKGKIRSQTDYLDVVTLKKQLKLP